MCYLASGIGRPISEDSVEVYFDLLGDLDYKVFQTAARRSLLEHKWATFPSIAELREAATATMRGEVKELSPGEAWKLAWQATGRIDPECEGSVERGTAKLPKLVREAMTAFGINALCYGKEPVGVVRGQFIKIFEQLQARDRRVALLPGSVKEAIEGAPAMLEAIRGQVAQIGVMDG
jgi:hypothetical protein